MVAAGGVTVVGIGASAGGLEALQAFLRGVPERSGCAFVVVHHQDPTHTSLMPELLARATPLVVVAVEDGARIEPECVYVIPPNADLAIAGGVLHLQVPAAPRGQRLPIDAFFRSLAGDQQERSVGVILSGMGSDGTLGLRAIREQGGAAFVQDPASARFDGMPRSAIEGGLADGVAPAEDLPRLILGYLAHARPAREADDPASEAAEAGVASILTVLRDRTGQDFSQYRRSTMVRRVERRMGVHQLGQMPAYLEFLRENPGECELLARELLIGVTSFFRDPAVWEQLSRESLPRLLAGRSGGEGLRAWVPACSTGEEAFSVAIALREACDLACPGRSPTIRIFATDLDRDAIDRARRGLYPASIAADVSAERLARFFVVQGTGYRVGGAIRESVVFAHQNVLSDPPFSRLDLLSCRNLLIYLLPELQRRVVDLFHHCLRPGGLLLLGTSETVGALTPLFEPESSQSRIYRHLEAGRRVVDYPTGARTPPTERPEVSAPRHESIVQAAASELMLRQYAPSAVLVNRQGDILFVSGRTGKYLEPPAGKVNWNLFAMAREGLREALLGAFPRALHAPREVIDVLGSVGEPGDGSCVRITLEALTAPAALQGLVVVVFAEASPDPVAKPGAVVDATREPGDLTALESELQILRTRMRIQQEEAQLSQELLRSANEELQSLNEELQSTNEELTTSKEELQSLNEELQTVNQQLEAKAAETAQVGDDMRNLLDSTEIATLFLDAGLRVRRYTPAAARLVRLIPTDMGRPVTDIAGELVYPQLADDVAGVLGRLISMDREVTTGDGRHFAVRVMPYRTQRNLIDGVVITFVDISRGKLLEAEMNQARSALEARIALLEGELERTRRLEASGP